jgi:hypothetical protein
MSNTSEDNHLREQLELNEFMFYYYMPNSEVEQNNLGYFIKNKSIETYSYISSTQQGDVDFEDFLRFAFSYFGNGEEYFVVKMFHNNSFRRNSKILREKNFIQYPIDTSLMYWTKDEQDKLIPDKEIELHLLTEKSVRRWIDVFFDAFSYPLHLKKYISEMVDEQLRNGIEFYVGRKHGKDVSCFCAFDYKDFIGFYGVGTRKRFRRQGFATKVMSNYILEKLKEKPNAKFCLQAQNNSGAEELYLNLGFTVPFIQKRFDWDPSTCNLNL